MYGTTIKSYSASKATGGKSIFSKKANTTVKKDKKVRETRYLKIENNAMPKFEATTENTAVQQDSSFSKKEFPIPSVIITVLLTMVMLVVVSGLIVM